MWVAEEKVDGLLLCASAAARKAVYEGRRDGLLLKAYINQHLDGYNLETATVEMHSGMG